MVEGAELKEILMLGDEEEEENFWQRRLLRSCSLLWKLLGIVPSKDQESDGKFIQRQSPRLPEPPSNLRILEHPIFILIGQSHMSRRHGKTKAEIWQSFCLMHQACASPIFPMLVAYAAMAGFGQQLWTLP